MTSGDERAAEAGGELASRRPERSASERERGTSGDERSASERDRLSKDAIGLVLRLVIGGVLLLAGGLKVGNLSESRFATRAYELLPTVVANFVGSLLPFVEVTLGGLLVLGLLTRGAALLGGLLMLAFAGAIASAWARGLTIDCGCFGGGGQVGAHETAYLPEILRDVALALGASWLVLRPRTRLSLDGRLWGA